MQKLSKIINSKFILRLINSWIVTVVPTVRTKQVDNQSPNVSFFCFWLRRSGQRETERRWQRVDGPVGAFWRPHAQTSDARRGQHRGAGGPAVGPIKTQ